MTHSTLHTLKSTTEITTPEDRNQALLGNWSTELAFANNFLLRGLLSLSTLHLAHLDVSRQKHTLMAIHHHGLGIDLFRPQLSNITDDKHYAVFMFSFAVALDSFGIQRYSESEISPIPKINQVLILIRGSGVIFKYDNKRLKRSYWSVLIVPDYFP
jgi:hypothetical protein